MRKGEPWSGSVTIRVSAASIIGLFVVGFISVFAISPEGEPRQIIEFAAKALFGGAAIFSAYIAGTALWLNLIRDRQKVAHGILEDLNARDMVEAKVLLDREITGDTKPAEVYDKFASDPHKAQLARRLLGMYEDCAIAIRTGYADEATIFHSSGSSIIAYYDRLRPYIAGVRQQAPQYCFYYIELENLVNHWKSRKSRSANALPGTFAVK